MPSVDEIAQDTFGFHIKVVQELYRNEEERPPVYVMAYSMGAMQTFNILTTKYNQGAIKYTAVSMLNPFFAFGTSLVNLAFPALKMAHRMNPDSYTFELKMNPKRAPEHALPWIYDTNNPIQRKRFPVRTMLEMDREIKRIATCINLSKTSRRPPRNILCGVDCYSNVPRKNMYIEKEDPIGSIKIPIQIHVGTTDKVVSNNQARKVFTYLDSNKCEFIEHQGLDHGAFSNRDFLDQIYNNVHRWFDTHRSPHSANLKFD